MADHVLRLQSERPAHTTMYWVPEDGRRKRGNRKRHGEALIWKRWVLADMNPTGSPVIVRVGHFSLADALRGQADL